MERLVPLLEAEQQSEVAIVAASRGENEDRDLERTFLHIAIYSTEPCQKAIKSCRWRN